MLRSRIVWRLSKPSKDLHCQYFAQLNRYNQYLKAYIIVLSLSYEKKTHPINSPVTQSNTSRDIHFRVFFTPAPARDRLPSPNALPRFGSHKFHTVGKYIRHQCKSQRQTRQSITVRHTNWIEWSVESCTCNTPRHICVRVLPIQRPVDGDITLCWQPWCSGIFDSPT